MEEKKEIPAGLKEYVFAMYIGQDIIFSPLYGEWLGDKLIGINKHEDKFYMAYSYEGFFSENKPYLKLRPLSAITDAEAINISKTWGAYNATDKQHIKIGEAFIKGLFELNSHSGLFIMQVYQYLQQQGFAMPIWFQGTLFSVEQLVEMNIIKLVE